MSSSFSCGFGPPYAMPKRKPRLESECVLGVSAHIELLFVADCSVNTRIFTGWNVSSSGMRVVTISSKHLSTITNASSFWWWPMVWTHTMMLDCEMTFRSFAKTRDAIRASKLLHVANFARVLFQWSVRSSPAPICTF